MLFSLSGLRNQKNESAASGWNLCLSPPGTKGVEILEPNVKADDFSWLASGFFLKVENPPESQEDPGELPSIKATVLFINLSITPSVKVLFKRTLKFIVNKIMEKVGQKRNENIISCYLLTFAYFSP